MRRKPSKGKLFVVPHMGGAAVTRAEKKLALEAAKEQERIIAIVQRAVDASNFLPIHGFLTERQAYSLANKVRKYLIKHKLILVDKSFKEYVVLPPNAKLRSRWQHIFGERSNG
jgi:hypothetical protein